MPLHMPIPEVPAIRALYETDPWWFFCSHWLPAGFLDTAGAGEFQWLDNFLRLDSGTTINQYARADKYVSPRDGMTWNAVHRFKVWVEFYDPDLVYTHVVHGNISDETSIENIDRHIGFKMDDRSLYATVGNGSAESTLLVQSGVPDRTELKLEAILTPGVECRFYVDGVDKGAITTNLPTGTGDVGYLFAASVYNLEASRKRLNLYHLRALVES